MLKDNFHIPVLLNKAMEYLINKEIREQVIVDGTLGGGGYTKLICEKLKQGDRIISIDKDIHSIEHAKEDIKGCEDKLTIINGNFGDLKILLDRISVKKITGLALDLGLSSYQLEYEEGFSFMKNTPLDMRAFKGEGITAADILNLYSREELSFIFKNFGEIGNSERLAKAIINRKKKKKISMTFDIVDLVKEEYQINKKNLIDFLAKIFQSLRIEVNNELKNLEKVLNDSIGLIEKGGRIVVISYHSLEDRMVKNFFKAESSRIRKSENPFFTEEKLPTLKILTKKPEVPTAEEIKFNSRSRSAKLRAAEIL